MSGPQTPEPTFSVQGDSPMGTRDEDAADGIQHSHRMLSFSDALLSIIATVMILPVTHTEISPEQFDKSIQKLLATRIAVYLMTFLIVTVAWAAHTRLFQVVGKIDDTLALLNLACMMTITFLPFTFSLMVTFPDVPLGIFLFCMCVIAIGAVQALIVVYAFHFPYLLNPQIERAPHRALYRQHILRIVLRGPALCFVAAGFSLFFYPLSYLLMAMVIFLPYVSKASSWCKGRLVGQLLLLARPQAPKSPQLTAWSSSLSTCTNLSARSGWRPSATGSTPSWPRSSSWTSVRTTSPTPRTCGTSSTAAWWPRSAHTGRTSWRTSAPSPRWACFGSRTTRSSCTSAKPRSPWGCSTRCRWPSWAASPWPTSRPRPSPASRATSSRACASAAPSSSLPASSSLPSGRRPCCRSGRRCSPPLGSGAASTRSCSPSSRCTRAPACWPSRPPAS
ncbi:endosomal/lysosomal proton channel TMEM175 isoform X2 [Canis aureus]